MATTVRIISWNVRGLNCPLKRGSVHRYSCDVAILIESKLEEVDHQVVDRCQVKWVSLPFFFYE